MFERLIMGLGLTCLSVGLYAQPHISQISNELAARGDSLKIIIQGGNFGAGPEVLYFNDFSAANEGQSLRDVDHTVGEMLLGHTAPTIASYQRQKGMQIVDEETGKYSIVRVPLGKVYNDVFVAYSVAVPKGKTTPSQTAPRTWGGSTWKFTWLMEDGGAHSNNEKFDLVAPQQNSNSTTLHGNASAFRGHTGGTFVALGTDKWFAWDTFNHISVWLDANMSDPSRSRAAISTVNNRVGLLHVDTPDSGYLHGPTPKISVINFPGWVRKSDQDDFQAIYTNMYVAGGRNAKARVELTDSADYAKSTYRKVLPPTSWSGDKIEVSLHKSNLGTLGNLYVHVFNSENERTSAGVLSCQICPAMGQRE